MPEIDAREMAGLAVEMFVTDVGEAIRFYEEAFGLELIRKDPPDSESPAFAIGALAGATLMFMDERWYTGRRNELEHRGAGIDLRIMVPDVDAVYEMARSAGMQVMHDIGDREYGLRDFIVRDPFGFRLRFAAPIR
jgi:uncharacterized glyoxalase superfamily protein PhnB